MQPVPIQSVIPLPVVDDVDELALSSELALLRSACAAAAVAAQTPAVAKCLEQIAALEKANLKLTQQAAEIISKRDLRKMVDRIIAIVADATCQPVPTNITEQIHDIVRSARNSSAKT